MNFKKTSSFLLALICYVTISIAQTSISNFSPTNIIGGIGQVLTISGSDFGNQQGNNYVTFLSESGSYLDENTAKSLKYISWINTKIEVEMPNAYSGIIEVNINGTKYTSTDTLKVKANLGYTSPNPLDYLYLYNQNGKGGYTWYMHRSYWDNPSAKSAIEDVFKEFRCKTGVNFILANEPSDASLTLSDTVNLIAPDPSLGSGGYQYLLWNSCIVGNNTFYFKKAMDIGLSDKENWYYDTGKVANGKSKFRYVLMHELGHALSLGHVNELGQTMYPTVTLLPSDNWCERDSITTEEQIAMSYMVNLSQNFYFRGCGVSPLLKVFNCNDIFGLTSAIEETITDRFLSIFPNPSQDIFTIEWANHSTNNKFIKVYNLLGDEIRVKTVQSTSTSCQINLFDFPSGIYLIKLFDGVNEYIEKLIKL